MKKDIFFRGYDKICDIMQSNGNKKVSGVKLEEGVGCWQTCEKVKGTLAGKNKEQSLLEKNKY